MHLLQSFRVHFNPVACSQPCQPIWPFWLVFGRSVHVQYGTWYSKSRSQVAQGRWSLYPVQFLCRTVCAWKKGRQKQVVAKTQRSLTPGFTVAAVRQNVSNSPVKPIRAAIGNLEQIIQCFLNLRRVPETWATAAQTERITGISTAAPHNVTLPRNRVHPPPPPPYNHNHGVCLTCGKM